MEEERESRKLSDHFNKKNLASKRVGYSYKPLYIWPMLENFCSRPPKTSSRGRRTKRRPQTKGRRANFQPHFDGVNPKSKVSCHLWDLKEPFGGRLCRLHPKWFFCVKKNWISEILQRKVCLILFTMYSLFLLELL